VEVAKEVKKKEVHCYNCGFLCGQIHKDSPYIEINLKGRKAIEEKKGVGTLGVLCYRGLLGQENFWLRPITGGNSIWPYPIPFCHLSQSF